MLAHAITDAILGAAALGDIGQHFPDTDPRVQGRGLDRRCCARSSRASRAEGWRVEYVDATVMMERPKLAPHREAIMAAPGEAVGAPVHVKATTGEGMGFVGREEGVAALAVATLRTPWGTMDVDGGDGRRAGAGRGVRDRRAQARAARAVVVEPAATSGRCGGCARAAAPRRTRSQVELSGPAYKCSCPSRKVPCKHALALLLLRGGRRVCRRACRRSG